MDHRQRQELDQHVQDLKANKGKWAATGIPERIQLLRQVARSTGAVADQMVEAACEAKGIEIDSPQAGEEWLGGPVTIIRNARLLMESLEQIQRRGTPRLGLDEVRTRVDGQVVADVFPRGVYDRLLFAGFRAEVWMEPGVDEGRMRERMARSYRGTAATLDGALALVLGAGNVASIGPMDVLHKLFVENQVCVLKMNPVNDYLGPHVERAFAPLVGADLLRVVYGGVDVGEYLVHHPDVEEVHITGSDRVHDIIVWGKPGADQQANRDAGTPRLTKPISSELGCVTPVIVVPGRWSEKDLDFQAANVATMVANNASFNCNAAKLLVTSRRWPQRMEFLRRVERVLASLPEREAYYPGADLKYDEFLAAHPEARPLASRRQGSIPWTTIFDVDPDDTEDIVFKREAWCGVLAETTLGGQDGFGYLRRAVDFVNDHVWGTLSCVVLIHPDTQQQLGSRFEQAIADLRYGSICVNHWAALSYGLGYTTWGAYPGHTLEDIGSGRGVVHNTLMFDSPQKSVVYGPFSAFPKPPWFSTHRRSHQVGRSLARFEQSPSLTRALGVVYHALRA